MNDFMLMLACVACRCVPATADDLAEACEVTRPIRPVGQLGISRRTAVTTMRALFWKIAKVGACLVGRPTATMTKRRDEFNDMIKDGQS